MIKQGLIWDFIGKVFNQGVTFIVSIFLARLLLPEDFAIVAMAMAFFGIARVFIDFGLSAALIQKQDTEDIHYHSIFWINIAFSILIGGIFFLSAVLIADFYQQKILIPIVQVLSTVFFISALGGVHTAMLKKKLNFKYLSTINVISAVVSGTLGITLAYTGYGVWSIVAQYILAAIIRLILLWKATLWLPKLQFSWTAVQPLWNFGKKLFFAALIENIANQLDVFVVGKLFPPATLGFYARGKSLNQLIATYSSSSLSTVLFPALSQIQNNLVEVKKKVKAFFRLAALGSFYLGGFLYLTSEDIIVLMFTDKWLPTVPYFRIMVLSTFAYPLSVILLTPLQSLGRSDIFLRLEIIKKFILAITYIVGFQFGLTGFLYASLISRFIGVSINGYYTGELINWKLSKQLFEILIYGIPSLIGSYIIFIFIPNQLIPNHFFHLLISGSVFTIYFIGINLIFKTKGSQIIVNLVSTFLKNRIK